MTAVTVSVADPVQLVSPREVYSRRLIELAGEHPEVVAIAADLAGSNKFDALKKAFPGRMFNVGIAEQNLMGVAAGLALDGKVPFVTTFATFASMRAHEQVRTDIAYPNLPVKIIATVGGLSGGVMGPTHHGMEDMGTMRMIPNMTVVAPSDPRLLDQFVEQAYETSGPVYLRIGRGEDPVVYPEGQRVTIGKAVTAREGSDLTIISTGLRLHPAMLAASRLAEQGISARVLDMHTLRPLDLEAVLAAVEETGAILTVEDHTVIGGLGSAVAEVLADAGKASRFRRLGIPDVYALVGPPADLYRHYGLDDQGIAAAAVDLLR